MGYQFARPRGPLTTSTMRLGACTGRFRASLTQILENWRKPPPAIGASITSGGHIVEIPLGPVHRHPPTVTPEKELDVEEEQGYGPDAFCAWVGKCLR